MDDGRISGGVQSLRLGSGSPPTQCRWFVARSKASRTAFRTQEERASVSLSLSSVWSTPKGAILDLGSHCLRREKAAVSVTGGDPSAHSWSSTSIHLTSCWSAKEVKPNRKSTILSSSNRINQNDLIVLVQFKTRIIRLETGSCHNLTADDKCRGLKTYTCKYYSHSSTSWQQEVSLV